MFWNCGKKKAFYVLFEWIERKIHTFQKGELTVSIHFFKTISWKKQSRFTFEKSKWQNGIRMNALKFLRALGKSCCLRILLLLLLFMVFYALMAFPFPFAVYWLVTHLFMRFSTYNKIECLAFVLIICKWKSFEEPINSNNRFRKKNSHISYIYKRKSNSRIHYHCYFGRVLLITEFCYFCTFSTNFFSSFDHFAVCFISKRSFKLNGSVRKSTLHILDVFILLFYLFVCFFENWLELWTKKKVVKTLYAIFKIIWFVWTDKTLILLFCCCCVTLNFCGESQQPFINNEKCQHHQAYTIQNCYHVFMPLHRAMKLLSVE